MDAGARARANIPRPGNRQPLTGLDPYHRLLRETNDGIERRYVRTKGSFSVPRPFPQYLFDRPSPGSEEDSGASVNLENFPVPPSSSGILTSVPTLVPTSGLDSASPSAAEWFGSSKSPSRSKYASPEPAPLSSTLQESDWFGSSRNQSRLEYTSPRAVLKKPSERSIPKIAPRSVFDRSSRGSSTDVHLPWRPSYMRRRILFVFAILLASLIVALEIIIVISNQRNGLVDSSTLVWFLWQYGVTFFFVLLAAGWTRVDHQVRASAPWIRLVHGPADVDSTLLLDYVSMFQPFTTIRAVRNRDLLVAASGAVHICLNALILLAAAIATQRVERNPALSSTSTSTVRLMIRTVPVHLMAGLLGICLMLTILAIFFVPGHGFLPRNPNTIIGTGALLTHSDSLLQALRAMGGASTQGLRDVLEGSTYYTAVESYNSTNNSNLGWFKIYTEEDVQERQPPRSISAEKWRQPVSLRGMIRLLFALVFTLAILGLEVSLRVSEQENGLATVDGASYQHLFWTLIPALVFLSLACYIKVEDFWTRTLAPMRQLVKGGKFFDSMNLNLIDAWKPTALWVAIKFRDAAVVMTVLGAIIATLLVVASAALFDVTPIRKTDTILLSTKDFFADSLRSSPDDPTCVGCTNDTTVASEILLSNASYPPFTFGELTLPTMAFLDNIITSNDSQASMRVPAVRAKMVCRLYQRNEVVTNLTVAYSIDGIVNPLRVDLGGEPCRGRTERTASNVMLGTSASRPVGDNVANYAFFGTGIAKTNATSQCSDWLYVWGQLTNANTNRTSVRSIMAMTCNETIEAVDTDVVYQGTNLAISVDQPPVPDETTARDTAVAKPPIDYSLLGNTSPGNLLDSFFSVLGSSNSTIADGLLGDSSLQAGQEVEEAIKIQHGIIRAQSLNFKNRRHLSEAKTFPSINGEIIKSGLDPSASTSQAVPTVTATEAMFPLRLKQVVLATRILQGLLGSVLLFHLLSWVLSPKSTFPRPPTTIASVGAYLVDGNVLQYLPPVTEWQPIKDMESLFYYGFNAMMFTVGWDGTQAPTQNQGATGAGGRLKGNYAVRVSK